MSHTFEWCLDKTRLEVFNKQVFYINRNGTKRWVLHGNLHRVNGPAVEYAKGDKYWYLNGELHRENGPAVECANRGKRWFLNGLGYSESDYWKELNK